MDNQNESSEAQKQLEELLCDSISGDNQKIMTAYQFFLHLLNDPKALMSNLFYIIIHTDNSTSKNAAFIVLARIIKDNLDNFDESFCQSLFDSIFELEDIIDESNLHSYVQLVHAVHNKYTNFRILTLFNYHNLENGKGNHDFHYFDSNNQVEITTIQLDEDPKDFTPLEWSKRSLKAHFFIEFFTCFNGTLGIPHISSSLQDLIKINLLGLNDDQIYYQNLAIKGLSIILELFPSEIPHLTANLQRMFEISKNSLTMTEKDFKSIWNSIGDVINLDPSEIFSIYPLKNFLSINYDAANRTDIAAESRIIPFLSFRQAFGYVDLEDLPKFARISIDISKSYIQSTHNLPTDFIFFYDAVFNMFPHKSIYDFARALGYELLQQSDYCSNITDLCLVKSIITNLPNQIFLDIELVTTITETALRQTDILYLEAGCDIVSSFYIYFTWNLADPQIFLPLTTPLLVHEHPDVREKAYEAVHNIFRISFIHNPQSIPLILQLSPQVIEIDYSRYLGLLSVAIKNQDVIEREQMEEIIKFVFDLYESPQEQCSFGAVEVAFELMIACEESIPILLEKSMQIVDRLILEHDDIQWLYFGVRMFEKYFKMETKSVEFKLNRKSKLINQMIHPQKKDLVNIPIQVNQASINLISKYAEKIFSLLQIDDKTEPLMKIMLLPKIAFIDSIHPDHPFLPCLLTEIMPFIEVESPIHVVSAIKVLKRVINFLPGDLGVNAFNAIGTACVKTKELVVAGKAYKAMANIIDFSPPEKREAYLPTARHMCMLYAKGELAVLSGVPPMSTDFDFTLMYWAMHLFIALTFEKSEMQQFVLHELFRIYIEKHNLMTNEMLLYVFSVSLKADILTEEEVENVYKITLSLLDKDIHIVLMISTATIFSTFIIKKMISDELLNRALPIFVEWWNRINHEKHVVRSTRSTMALLFLLIADQFKLIDKMLQMPASLEPSETTLSIIEDAFDKEFPPSNMQRVNSMTRFLISLFTDDQTKTMITSNSRLSQIIAISICKFLIRPKMFYTRYDISEMYITQLGEILDLLRKGNGDVQIAINQYIQQAQSRIDILGKFLSP